ncbi:MAG TPA: peptidylprolyl isomerase [Balneolaceae bacterium]|nr:peptidylprolyl isomerase [Balneolaceae bacterium]
MKYIRFRGWFFLLAIVVIVLLLLKLPMGDGIYKSDTPITDSLITSAYPELYEAISKREAALLKPFLTHQSEEVRQQAWRAFAVTQADSLSPFINLAVQQNTEVAWFGLSQHEMTRAHLRQLEALWNENSSLRKGISTVLGQQGDEQSLDFLLNKLDTDIAHTFPFALAISHLDIQFEMSEDEQIAILQQAFDGENERALRAYLYGWYRASGDALTPAAEDTLFNRWRLFGAGTNPKIDQYVNKLLKERTTSTLAIFYNGEQRLEDEIQLSIELAQSMEQVEITPDNALAAKILLVHSNPLVKKQVLQSLTGKLGKSDGLYEYIKNSMVKDSTLANLVWLQALETVAQVEPAVAMNYRDRLNRIPEKNPYLISGVLTVYEEFLSPEEYLQQVEGLIEKKEPIFAMEALQSLNIYWENLPEEAKSESLINKVRELVFRALDSGDRGIAYVIYPLLKKDDLFYKSDFEAINEKLAAFSLPGDIEVFQRFGLLYKERFEEQARPVIDSLVALNYAPLNRSLADAGWDVALTKEPQIDFRMPDWERLWQLGRHPVWTLQTAKGEIKIRMNTLSAPATISAIDSLSRAGAYEGVPFHRVVPNFVIQGGDITRQDGFGGPDFVIPTEPSEKGFVRGAVGIASAGTDTEGSQYFIMHQWSPHLNGNYTRFGEVVEGIDVVDQIVPGDEVLRTTWF